MLQHKTYCCLNAMSSFWTLTYVPLTIVVLRMFNCQQMDHFIAAKIEGRPQCSTEHPISTQRVRSIIECSRLCAQLENEGCTAFNFKKKDFSCELFLWTKRNYLEVPGCTLYEVGPNTLCKTEYNTESCYCYWKS